MNRVIKIIITILIIIESVFMYLTYKSFTNKPSNINEVAIKGTETIPINNGIAVLVESSTFGKYDTYTDKTKWPDTNTYVYQESECYDGLGKMIFPDITFDAASKKFTMKAKTSTYCYIKFARKTSPNIIIPNAGSQIETIANMKEREDNVRRFQGPATGEGAVLNNYICLGTSNKTTCTGTPGTYMYRIIGIDTTNSQLKVIKQTSLSSGYAWHSTYGYTWGYPCDLSTGINGAYFLTNATYKLSEKVGSTAKTWTSNVIAPHTWQYGDLPYDNSYNSKGININSTGKEIFDLEKEKWTSGISTNKIGLMYVHDSILATEDGENKRCVTSYASDYYICGQNWILSSSGSFWTMTTDGTVYAWVGSGDGGVARNDVRRDLGVRPVFFLQSTIQISGTGLITDPYIINNV